MLSQKELLAFLGPDLTKKGTICLSKALIENVSLHSSAIITYSKYFKDFTLANPDSNLSCIKARPKMFTKVVNSMYNLKSSKSDPAFFTFDSFYDVCRLSTIVQREIVIYYVVGKNVEIFHDFRLLSKNKFSPLYFVLTNTKTLHAVKGCLDSQVDYSDFICDSDKIQNLTDLQDWGPALCKLLKTTQEPTWPIQSLNDIDSTKKELYELWQESILFVVLSRSKFSQKTNNYARKNPKFSYFTALTFVGPEHNSVSSQDLRSKARVVCVFANSRICELNEVFRKHVIDTLLVTTNRDKPNPHNFFNVPYVDLEARRVAEALSRAKQKKQFSSAELKSKICKCHTCKLPDFDYNMSKAGPERLMTYPLDVSELLVLMGLHSTSNMEILEQLRELSLASMDIESMTVPLDLHPPVEEDTGLVYGVIDEAVLEGHLKKVQKPIMIAHLDKLLKDDPSVFVARSDKEEDLYQMMRDYWTLVEKQHTKTSNLKRKLAEPILSIVYKYREAHFSFYNTWCQIHGEDPTEMKSITKAWKQSMPGKLESGLQKLITDYIIFSFYG
jgi:hypothetical protein